jgi:serine/threonine protein kinase
MKPSPVIQCPKCTAQIPSESKFCLSCGQPVSTPSQMPTAQIPAGVSPKAAMETPHVARIISSDSIPAGGFTPGTILADRYRIIGLLGRGGMGEVYRADDLKLGQPVALKFLPPKLAQDPVRRERFFAEVRITRQLSHPNICRVYDIGEIDGRHFLSMEFIDGEDLASLLKRIGHLTNEKALDIARQLAAGLAAAHERGVLHRDLKPANIMLDGHGRVRITDFGLAIAVEDETQAAEIAGTPAYMAPEQLAGKGATVRSDIYFLGLVLYEIYTGKKAFSATTLPELRQQKETHTPRAISELREGMDPVVERLIRRCMERDPNSRPSSVAQLALALPGGDPLAAAIAAGETPSPEMVAASGSKEGLRPAVAWGLLAAIAVGWMAIIMINDRIMLHRRISFEIPPEILAERSRQFLRKIGYSENYKDSAYGFMMNSDLLRYIESQDKTSNRWKNLDAKAIHFWRRQSPSRLEGDVGYGNPPLHIPGEALVVMDVEGNLELFRRVPPVEKSSAATMRAPDWSAFFVEAGLDSSQWKPVNPQSNPPFYADMQAAWQGSFADRPNDIVRIEAAALHGKPVSFEIIDPRIRAAKVGPSQTRMATLISNIGYGALFTIAIVGGLFFAHRNLRLGRGDRRNALRLAVFMLVSIILIWILELPHVSRLVLLQAPWVAGIVWIFYIAIEPFVRRKWPQILVSWTRLLSGEWRDPLVARDVLVGAAIAALMHCINRFSYHLLPSWLGYPDLVAPTTFTFASVMGIRSFVSIFLGFPVYILLLNLGLVCLLLIMKVLLKNQKAAVAVCILVMALMIGFENIWTFAISLVLGAMAMFVLVRFGLVAIVFVTFTVYFFSGFPITFDASAWYAGYGYAALGIFAALVLYAFRTSLGGRPLLTSSRLDD